MAKGGKMDDAIVQRMEADMKELKRDRDHKDKKIQQLQQQIDQIQDHSSQNMIELFTARKERDIARFNLE